MEWVEWKEKTKTVFGRRHNIEEGNNNLYLYFTDQCEPYLKTKIKFTKGYNKSHNSQGGIKLMELIRSVFCFMVTPPSI